MNHNLRDGNQFHIDREYFCTCKLHADQANLNKSAFLHGDLGYPIYNMANTNSLVPTYSPTIQMVLQL